MRHLNYSNVQPGDLVIVTVPVVVRVTKKTLSDIASGMREFRAETIDVPSRYTFHMGTLVDASVYDNRGEASAALAEFRGVA